MELHRGQHPHAVQNFLQDTGPSTWASPVETGRIIWEERFVPEDKDGYNPIASDVVASGQTLEARNKAARLREIEAEKQAAAAKALSRRTPRETPSAAVARPSPPKTAYGMASEAQRKARAEELYAKLGVANVQLVTSPLQIDTTAKAGHHTATTSPPSGGANPFESRLFGARRTS